ncbi:hypothetical protein C8P67_105202 [Flavobacterium aquicola]|uniref:Uncharacterized protein n=1 Tax=Flavobacterium aquicola TaxID=1682742 RepID=A0A3E0EPF8_9FLAO|nr:hypothetical protein C8P67_105202 [Flavobacterium aquicola]
MFIMKPSVQKWIKKNNVSRNNFLDTLFFVLAKKTYSLSRSLAVLNPASKPTPAIIKIIDG